MNVNEDIEVKPNLRITCRERGKIVDRREGHNIWLAVGREYLAKLIAYQSYDPDVPFIDARIKYIGLGIGGTRQVAPNLANNAPISPPYVGTNVQNDVSLYTLQLERPVRLSGSSTNYPGVNGDVWLGRVDSADVSTEANKVVFRRVISQTEVNYGPFTTMPLSEIGMFIATADPSYMSNAPVAYDTFDTISKTSGITLEVEWSIHFT